MAVRVKLPSLRDRNQIIYFLVLLKTWWLFIGKSHWAAFAGSDALAAVVLEVGEGILANGAPAWSLSELDQFQYLIFYPIWLSLFPNGRDLVIKILGTIYMKRMISSPDKVYVISMSALETKKSEFNPI